MTDEQNQIINNKEEKEKIAKEIEEFPDDFYAYDKEKVHEFYQDIVTKIRKSYKLADDIKIEFPNTNNEDIDQIIFSGMGGSAIAGIILKDYIESLNPKLTVLINNNYHLPKHISKNALVICVSYSGNTEETLSTFKDAQRNSLRVMSVCSGGKLAELTKNYRLPLVNITPGFHPRQAFPFEFFPLIKILEKLTLIEDHSAIIENLTSVIIKKNFKNIAIDLTNKIFGKKILIYTSKSFEGVAYRWKTQINENSKVPAFTHVFPELCHNEICQFMNKLDDFHVIILKNNKDTVRMQKRIDITKKLISKNCDVTELDITGNNDLIKIYSAVLIGDLTSYFLAIKNRRDPSDDSIIGTLKKELGPWIN